MNTDKYVFVLINGWNSSKIYWKYADTGTETGTESGTESGTRSPKLRKLVFFTKLQKLGNIHTFN